ncbi:ABC transporter permease [Rathayibacter sp. KR2-224]|uniref:ABC transporter permease n=1 Tax=Rathayibacter sp. KR2-224 TaxID=3400913 RepID=UPI003C0A32AC
MTSTAATGTQSYVTPGHSRGLIDVFRYRYLLRLLIRKGIQTRYHGSVLGWTWSYVKPAAQFFVYFFALGVFLGLNKGVPNFPIYLFSGMIVINLFGEAFTNATRSIVDNGALVQKIYLPRELFPLAAVFVAFVHFLPQVVVLFIGCLITGWVPGWLAIASFLLGVLIVTVLSTGLGLLFGAINTSFRDAQNLVDLFLLFATWASPVLYHWNSVQSSLPPWAQNVYMLNPLTPAVELMHLAFWSPTLHGAQPAGPPNLMLFSAIALVTSIVILVLGQLTFRKLEGRFAQDL